MIPAVLLLVTAVLYRIATTWFGGDAAMNFAPVAAIALCAPALFPKRLALLLPLAILAVSDVILNSHYGAPLFTPEMMVRYGALAMVAYMGLRLAASPRWYAYAAGSIGGSIWFYLVTNTVSWLTAPEYAKTLAGWVQALTVGVPGHMPTWMFFRNTLAGDLVFALLFIGCLALGRKWSARTAPAAQTVEA